MKRIKFLRLTVLVCSLSLCALLPAMAQVQPAQGWQQGGVAQRRFNANALETVTGEVIAVETVNSASGRSGGMHVRLRTSTNEAIEVHFGPVWFMNQQPMTVQVADKIQVRGSRVTLDNQATIIATEVHKGEQVLMLRDEVGRPVWRGRNPQSQTGRKND